MKAFLIYKEDYPWDVRVEKIALSLSKADYDVTIVCRNLDQNARFETLDGYQIRRLPRTSSWPKSVQKLLNIPVWFNPLWLYTIYKTARESDGGILIVRDLPLVKSALLVGKLLKLKVIYDMAEVYPEMYASSAEFSKKGWITKLYKNSKIALHYEDAVLPKVDQTLVMIEESRERLLRKGIPSSKITIVSNTPPEDKFNQDIKEHQGTTLYLVYVGFLTKLRGLDLLISGAEEFLKNQTDKDCLYIDIVGKGDSFKELQTMISDAGLETNIRLHGWLEQKDVDKLMARANVGALTYRVCGHWNHTIPNKIFDYMLAGLPVLTTPVIPIKRIVKTTDCGVIASDTTPQTIARCLKELQDPNVRQNYGNNGNASIQKLFNWSQDEQRLYKACKDLSELG
ncbi:glycosyltransferase family 4 protein [Marinobacter alexandrii]|uniref:glycosyltransferase family 4 protein n=1 Tax=Marinobacter alexandrii TaxID=2570351 RepID=UPI0032645674